MKITLWGTRGSLASPGPETLRYGGNTSCVEVRGDDGTFIVLDAGTGIRRLGLTVTQDMRRVDILLTHLHMDHIEGLGFFDPFYRPGMETHIWGPASTTRDLHTRLARYLSPPLFPVRLRDLPCRLVLHDVPLGRFTIGGLILDAALVCHPGPTVGYRISEGAASVAYLPDHEPALGVGSLENDPEWISGCGLATGVNLLIHDAQYTQAEYETRIGWGHSAMTHAVEFAALARARRLVAFHHDPGHSDDVLDRLLDGVRKASSSAVAIDPGMEGETLEA